MSIIRPFEATDIQKFHTVNADPWTATYHNGYYAQYLAQWPDLCYAAQGAFEDNVGAYSEYRYLAFASASPSLAPRPQGPGRPTSRGSRMAEERRGQSR